METLESDKNNKEQNEWLFVRMISDTTNSYKKYQFLS